MIVDRELSAVDESLLLANLNVTISRTENPDRLFAISQTTITLFGIFLFTTAPTLIATYGSVGIFGLVALATIPAILIAGYFPSALPVAPQETRIKKNEKSFAWLFTPLPLLVLIGIQN